MSDHPTRRIALVFCCTILLVFGVMGFYNYEAANGWPTVYLVRNGDTIYTIATKFNVPWQSIASQNSIGPPYTVTSGEVLIIPGFQSTCFRSTGGGPGGAGFGVMYANSTVSAVSSPPKYVMIRFDDSFQDQWENAVPVLASHGYRATFAVIVGSISSSNPRFCGMFASAEEMSWPEVQWLYTHGNEISDHTMTHAHLDSQSQTSLQLELSQSRIVITQHQIQTDSLTLPYGEGADNATILRYAFWVSHFRYVYTVEGVSSTVSIGIAGAVDNSGNAIPPTSLLNNNIQTQWIDINAEEGMNNLQAFVDAVDPASANSVIGLVYHHVGDSVHNSGYYVNSTVFAQQMQYLSDNGYTVVVANQIP